MKPNMHSRNSHRSIGTRFAFALVALLGAATLHAQTANRWAIDADGGIVWKVTPKKAHEDHIEMSGRKVSMIVTYGVGEDSKASVTKQVVFPTLRFQPNETRDHWSLVLGDADTPRYLIDRRNQWNETVVQVRQKGIMSIESVLGEGRKITFVRRLFPSVDKAFVFERFALTNNSEKTVTVELEQLEKTMRTNPSRGIDGGYVALMRVLDSGERTLKPGESTCYTLAFSARKAGDPELVVDAAAEEKARREKVEGLLTRLILETPDRVLNTAFAFAKIRAAESIYETKAGLLHGPGGGQYYAAVWANDQAEYANPLFGYLGDPTAGESAIAAYRLFARYMNPDFKPIPSSIISEGAGFWNGAGDRGDMAMISYGASRFALAYGRRETAQELWPLIEWCLEYCRRQITKDGVVASDSDELEGRFPAGASNLCTSSLYYDALLSAANLGAELGKPAAQLGQYREQAQAIRGAIERYFGTTVEGFATYRYFDKARPAVSQRSMNRHGHYANEPDHLRSWICMPLTVGIYERKTGTIDALFSPRLWTVDGLATEAGDRTFWDRTTLYALRGVFAADETKRALDFLTYYSNRRLLGEHVPYPVEAYPENNQRHLSAESALYCRIYTEGMFGIHPKGFRAFDCTPRLPAEWNGMRLRNIFAFGSQFDLSVSRENGQLKIEVTKEGKALPPQIVAEGTTVSISL